MTGGIENSIDWTAIGAIGQWVGALMTFAAVCVALFQTHVGNAKKLKIELSQDSLVSGSLGKGDPSFIITLSNVGNRRVSITEWRIKGDKTRGILKPSAVATHYSPLKDETYEAKELPVTLEAEDMIKIIIDYDWFLNALQKSWEYLKVNKNRKVIFEIIDSTGKKYHARTPLSMKQYIAYKENIDHIDDDCIIIGKTDGESIIEKDKLEHRE